VFMMELGLMQRGSGTYTFPDGTAIKIYHLRIGLQGCRHITVKRGT